MSVRRQFKVLAAVLALWGALPTAFAHDTPIAILMLRERSGGDFLVEWDFTSAKGLGNPAVVYPAHCRFQAPLLRCGDQGLVGTVEVPEVGVRYSGVIVRLTPADGAMRSYTLTADNKAITFAPGGGTNVGAIANLARSYIGLGIEHILLGIDHLLFVLGLIWLVRSRWMLVKTITAFTIAHSITLAAATLGLVLVAERTVNALIALSIAFVGIELERARRGQTGLSVQQPWVVAFLFGLLHGFGFAGALRQLGLTPESIPWALLFFNVGVEIGQLAFVFLVLALAWAHRKLAAELPRPMQALPAYAIGAIGMFWFFDRVAVILP